MLLIFIFFLTFSFYKGLEYDKEEASIKKVEREMERNFPNKDLCNAIIRDKTFAEENNTFGETDFVSQKTGKVYKVSNKNVSCGFAVSEYDENKEVLRPVKKVVEQSKGKYIESDLIITAPNSPCFGTYGFFEFDETLYLKVAESPRKYDISKLCRLELTFSPICTVRKVVKEYSYIALKDKAICQKVLDKRYKKALPHSFLRKPSDLRREIITSVVKSAFNGGTYPESHATELYIEVDYANQGKKEILIPADYSAGNGCNYRFLTVFNPEEESLTPISQIEPEVYYEGKSTRNNYEISCTNGRQDIIEIDGQHYLLTLQAIAEKTPEWRVTSKELNRLDRIIEKEDGTRTVEKLCSFTPHYTYKAAPFVEYSKD